MTFTRLVLILVGGLLIVDHLYGNDRLLESVATQVGYKLTDTFSQIAGRISP